MTYQSLLKATVERTELRESPPLSPLKVDEIEIQSLWFAGYFPDKYRSTSGQEVKIISPGEWNRGAGPDFLAAAVEIDGVLHHGPIELDLEARNWESHGHSTSESFDPVILHVVLGDEGPHFFTRTSAHREVPRIVLSSTDVSTALGLPRLTQALARPGRCLQPLSQMPVDAVDSLLQQAARHRAQLKAKRIHQIAARHGMTQALWESFADALGFAANRLPMRLLAQRLPISTLIKLGPDDAEAILFGTAGFLSPKLHETAPTDSRAWLESLWDRWWRHRPQFEFPEERSPRWNLRGSRPGNHPQRRLAALAAAVDPWPSLTGVARQNPPFEELSDTLGKLAHPFWDRHHTLHSQKTNSTLKILGGSRLREFLINTLYPLALVEKPSHWESYAQIRASAPNQKVKRCCERLFGSQTAAKPFLNYAWQHQALLQVYQDFCLEDVSNCAECPFPEQLRQYS